MLSWMRTTASASCTHPVVTQPQQPAEVRCSKYVPEDDDYDPAKPAYLLPATQGEVEAMERELLDKQISRLQVSLSRRSNIDPLVSLHYANVLDEMYSERLQFPDEPCQAEGQAEADAEPECAGARTILESGFRGRARGCSAWDFDLEGSCKSEPCSPWSDQETEVPMASDSENDWAVADGTDAPMEIVEKSGGEPERKATSSTAASDQDWERQETTTGPPCNPWTEQADAAEAMHNQGPAAEALLARVYGIAGDNKPEVMAAPAVSLVEGERTASSGSEAEVPPCLGAELRVARLFKAPQSPRSKAAALNSKVGCCGLWEVYNLLVSPRRH